MSPTNKPCPFCGKFGSICWWIGHNYSAECKACGIQLGPFATEKEADAAWDARPLEDKARAERDQAIKERDEAWENYRYEVKRRLASETHLTQVEGERDSAREALREAWREIRKRCRCDGMSEAGDILRRLSAAKAGVKLGEE